jgi:hypothetical protein
MGFDLEDIVYSLLGKNKHLSDMTSDNYLSAFPFLNVKALRVFLSL